MQTANHSAANSIQLLPESPRCRRQLKGLPCLINRSSVCVNCMLFYIWHHRLLPILTQQHISAFLVLCHHIHIHLFNTFSCSIRTSRKHSHHFHLYKTALKYHLIAFNGFLFILKLTWCCEEALG